MDLLSLVAPPLCLCCRAPLGRAARGPGLCGRCSAEIEAEPGVTFVADGIDRGYAPLAYDGTGRRLVAALKFSRLLVVAELAAALIADGTPGSGADSAVVVPVPGSPVRSLRRGFDPAWEIAAALAGLTGWELAPVLRRRDLRRQRGRPRSARLAQPPKIEATGTAPPFALLVDDVVTTGATVTASARVLRAAGSAHVHAVALAAVRPGGKRC